MKTNTHQRWLARAVLPAAVLVAVGCSSAHRGALATRTTTSSTAAAVPTSSTTAAPPVTAVPSPTTVAPAAPATPSGPGFDAARQQWQASPSVDGSAGQNVPLLQAITDLTNGVKTDRDTSGYPSAIGYLEDMTRLPVMGNTPAQLAQANVDIGALDSFFATPGLWGPV